jgi:hypothetical protein
MIPVEVIWNDACRGAWCTEIVRDIFRDDFVERMNLDELQGEGAIVVIKADAIQDDVKKVDKLNEQLCKLKWLVLRSEEHTSELQSL